MADDTKDTTPIPRYRVGGYGAMVESELGTWVRVEDVFRLARQLAARIVEEELTHIEKGAADAAL